MTDPTPEFVVPPTGQRITNLRTVYEAPSQIHGQGLFAARDFDQNAVLGHLDGQVVDYASHPDVATLEWNGIGGNLVLCRPFATLYALINHSSTPNLSIVPDGWAIQARRAISKDEELTLNYLEHGVPEAYLASPLGVYLLT